MERGTHNPRRAGSSTARTRSRNASRSAPSSALSSGAVADRDATPSAAGPDASSSLSSSYFYPNRFNPSLHSVGSRVSLSEQFATTRKEYEFGFDDAASFVAQSESEYDEGEEAQAEQDDDGEDDTLTTLGSFDSVVIVPPVTDGAGHPVDGVREQTVVDRVPRTHYELLCLPDEGVVTQGDTRRAYFRLYAMLHSSNLPLQYREAAKGYFSDVQVAFETLIGEKSRFEYDTALVDGEGEDEADSEHDGGDGGDGEDDKKIPGRRTSPRFVKRLRRQQEQGVTELGVQMDAQPLFSQHRKAFRHRQALPAGFCLTQTSTLSLPSVSRSLQPGVRRIYQALNPAAEARGDREDEDLELYCTPPTVTMAASVFATNARSAWLPPATVLSQQQNIIPDVFPKDRPLQWYSTYLSPLLNLRLRQELFLREPGLSEVALKRTLPDAVVELETDTMNAVSMTARVSHSLGLEGDGNQDVDEPVHVEASMSANRSWLARSYATRLGLAIHKKLSPDGGTVFACADSGTSSLWEQPSPVAFWDSQGPEHDSTGASWRAYMDNLAKFLGQGLMPYYYSPPTVEIGYRSTNSGDEPLGMASGRPFTKQARRGLRRLHDDVNLFDSGKGGSWTISGAVTVAGVAGYVRYGRDLFASCSSYPGPEEAPEASSNRTEHLGFRMEAELTTQKMKNGIVLSGPQWARSEISHLAVRCLKKIGKSSTVGLELGVSSASNSIVLSVYLSRSNSQRLVLPVMLFRDNPLVSQRFSTSHTRLLFWTAFLPALGLAAIDYLASRSRAEASSAKRSSGSNSKKQKKARRAQARVRDHLERRIAQRRAEADDLAAMFASPVVHRQRCQREDGGLVILEAKYGVVRVDRGSVSSKKTTTMTTTTTPHQWASPEEVADVTVAVAALVEDEGRLYIPEGLRKSNLLGFWDPKPGRTKWLVVRYMYGGREVTRAVGGRGELRLP